MARAFYLAGETIVKTDGSELGLAEAPIVVTPRFKHADVNTDEFDSAPCEVLCQGADVIIRMTLVHYDDSILQTAMQKSMADSYGTLQANGTIMRAGSTNSYVSLVLQSVLEDDWTFPNAYLAEMPVEMPLGTGRSLVKLTWRAIPYASEISPLSNASVLWTRG